MLLLSASLSVSSEAGAGGALSKFESAHTSDSKSGSSSSSSGSSSSSSSSDSSDDNSWDSDADSSSGGGGDADETLGLMLLCIMPPTVIPCMMPSHRVRRSPYSGDGLYIEPIGDRADTAPAMFTDVEYDAEEIADQRWVELRVGGFLAMNEQALLSHQLGITSWLGGIQLQFEWEHFYERLETGDVDHLNMYRMHYGFNVLGPFIDNLELYARTGLMLLHGEQVTPAFDIGLEARLYPVEPLAIAAQGIVSVFDIGPALLDARAQIGVSVGQVEVRAGPRVLYQGQAQGFWGPSANFAARF